MEVPKSFKPENKDLKNLLEEPKPKRPLGTYLEIKDYERIVYATQESEWILEYKKIGNSRWRWVLYEREQGERGWLEHTWPEMAKSALEVRLRVLHPLIEFLDLKEENYSLKYDTARTILDKFAVKDSEVHNEVEWDNKSNIPSRITVYTMEELSIRLDEYIENSPQSFQKV